MSGARPICSLLFALLAAACLPGVTHDTPTRPDRLVPGDGVALDLGTAPPRKDVPPAKPDPGVEDPGTAAPDRIIISDPGRRDPGGTTEAVVLPAGGFGASCDKPEDCESGLCVPAEGGRVCTQTCIDQCPSGWSCQLLQQPGADPILLCLQTLPNLCRPCIDDLGCLPDGLAGSAVRCHSFGLYEGSFCAITCEEEGDKCPDGYACRDVEGEDGSLARLCTPEGGTCECTAAAVKEKAWTSCAKDSGAGRCVGIRQCMQDGLSECSAREAEAERCDNMDNDCDSLTDEDLVLRGPLAPCPTQGVCGEGEGVRADCVAGSWRCDLGSVPGYAVRDVCCGDGRDNDCDGSVDEDPKPPSCTQDCDCDCDPVGDEDGDGVPDAADNCPQAFNPDQADLDGDRMGDPCDVDDDGDGSRDDRDCEPRNDKVHPGATELCRNGTDDDCDPTTACYRLSWSGGNMSMSDYLPVPIQTDAVTFYGYEGSMTSSAETGFERSDATLAMLVRDPNGLVHLLVAHDLAGDGSAGEVRMGLRATALGPGAGLELRDDPDDSYAWDAATGEGTFRWQWGGCCTDGMILGPLGTSPALCVQLTWLFHEGVDHLVLAMDRGVGFEAVELYPTEDELGTLEICADP